MKRILFLIVSLTVMVLFFPSPVMALGVAIGPATMEITNALRGGEYERVVTIFNPSEPETNYGIRADGQVASWLSFYEFDGNKAVQHFPIAGRSNVYVRVKVAVPSDVTNGNYTATIYAETVPARSGENMGATAIMQATSALTVSVSGTEVIQGNVNNIAARDTEAGLPLRLEVNFQNTGNVVVKPNIECQINRGTAKVVEITYNETAVKPESQAVIPVEWPTTADQSGEFLAKVKVSLAGKTIGMSEVPFKVLPPGTLTKLGEMTSLAYDGQPAAGSLLKIQAGFKTTGQADTRAKLIAEVYLDGSLVDTTKSEETLVPVGKSDSLIAYLRLAKTGKYTVRGWVFYDGKQTEKKEISLNIAGDAAVIGPKTESAQSFNFTLIIIIVICVLAAAFGYIIYRERWRWS